MARGRPRVTTKTLVCVIDGPSQLAGEANLVITQPPSGAPPGAKRSVAEARQGAKPCPPSFCCTLGTFSYSALRFANIAPEVLQLPFTPQAAGVNMGKAR
jgi:hypothetical protein